MNTPSFNPQFSTGLQNQFHMLSENQNPNPFFNDGPDYGNQPVPDLYLRDRPDQYGSTENTTIYTTFENLPTYPPNTDLNSVIQEIKSSFANKKSWQAQFTAIDNLRILHKYYPNEVTNLFAMFGADIIDAVNNVTTKILRNALIFLKEVFTNAQYTPLHQDIITQFVPIVLAKTFSEKSFVRDEAKEIFILFCTHSLQPASFSVICNCVHDKNVSISETSLKALARMLENCAGNIMNLDPSIWKVIVETLGKQLFGKRANMKKWSISIFEYIHKVLGQENFMSLLSNLLSPDECNFIVSVIREEMEKNPKFKRQVLHSEIKNDKRTSKMYNGENPRRSMNEKSYYDEKKGIAVWDLTRYISH